MGTESFLKYPGIDHTLATEPGSYPCPECGGEMEIRTDETKVKCPACSKFINREALSFKGLKGGRKTFSVDVFEIEDSKGTTLVYERYEARIPISAIDHQDKYKFACEACHKYGKNLACPPYSPTFSEYAAEAKFAKVICIRMPQELFLDVPLEGRYRICFRKARSVLVKELLEHRKIGFNIAGSGYCMACDICAVEEGRMQCAKPAERIFSLESLGTNLTGLTKTCFDLDLEWNSNEHAADFVCAIGAVFSRNLSLFDTKKP